MEVGATTFGDVVTYRALGRAAQEWLASRGLGQYVPAAHAAYADAIRSRVEAGTLLAVRVGGQAVGFFSLDPVASPWWPADGVPALYLGGMVVAPSARGRGVGRFIIRWSADEAARRGCDAVRLDCHAGNPWLCAYYESQGFVLRGRVEQHPGYEGCLYQLAIAPGASPNLSGEGHLQSETCFRFDLELTPERNPPGLCDRLREGLRAWLVGRGLDYAMSALGGDRHLCGQVGPNPPATGQDRAALANWLRGQPMHATVRLGAVGPSSASADVLAPITDWVFAVDTLAGAERADAAAYHARMRRRVESLRRPRPEPGDAAGGGSR